MKLDTIKGSIELPCMNTVLVDIDHVQANNYNPNSVPENNMVLLEESIRSNGFCFPVVVIWDAEAGKYIIVDGFHRYTVLKDRLGAKKIPVVVLNHEPVQRMAATVQFNRARGVHQVELMGDLVRALVEQDLNDEQISVRLGMEPEEVFRLKQITGIAELFKNQMYSRSWEVTEVNDAA